MVEICGHIWVCCKCSGMIMGASASSVWYNVRVPHPTKEVPILDYDLALLFQPMLMLGITVGVALSVVFPYWLITVLIIILFIGVCNRNQSVSLNESVIGQGECFCLISYIGFNFSAGTSSRSFFKGIAMWREETIHKVKIS